MNDVKEITVEEIKTGFIPFGYTLLMEIEGSQNKKPFVELKSFYLTASQTWEEIENKLHSFYQEKIIIHSIQLIPPHIQLPAYFIMQRLQAISL